MTAWRLHHLTREWVGPITVTADGDPVTGWAYALLPRFAEPASADDITGTPTELNSGLGILVGPGTDHQLAPGVYRIWIRYVDNPEAPVLDEVGVLTIT